MILQLIISLTATCRLTKLFEKTIVNLSPKIREVQEFIDIIVVLVIVTLVALF